MATLVFPELRSRGRAGYNGPGYPTIDPRVLQQAEQARITAQAAREQAAIQARAEAAQAEREFKAEQDAAKMKAQLEADIARQTAAFDLATTRTNSAWNLSKAKLEADKNKPTVEFEDATDPTMVIKRKMTEDQFARYQAEKKAAQNAPELAKLQAERAAHAQNILEGDKRFGFLNLSSRPSRVAELDSKIASLTPPPDLLTKNDVVAPTVAPAPTPRGFIGSPGANTFLADPSPLGMNRAETNAYAIKLNNQNAAPNMRPVVGDLRAAESNLSTGPIPQDPPLAPFNPNAVDVPPPAASAPQDLLQAPGFNPVMGNLRANEGNLVAPIPQDPPMAPFNPNAVDAPARPKIPQSHIDHLMKNPDAAKDFDEKYGAGTAEEILNR